MVLKHNNNMQPVLNWIKTTDLFSASQLDDAAFEEFRSSLFKDAHTLQPEEKLSTLITYLCHNIPSITNKLSTFEKTVLSLCQTSSKGTWLLQQVIVPLEGIGFHHTLCGKSTFDKQPLLILEKKLTDLDLSQCLEGSIERLHTLNASLGPSSFNSTVARIKYEFIHNQIAYFIASTLNQNNLSAEIGMEVHFANALMNATAEEYNLPRVYNVYIEDICKRSNWPIIQMACAHSVQKAWEEYFLHHLQDKLTEDLFTSIKTIDNPPSILASLPFGTNYALQACGKTSCLYLSRHQDEKETTIQAMRKISDQEMIIENIPFSEIDHFTFDTIDVHWPRKSPDPRTSEQECLNYTRLGNEFQHICLLKTLVGNPTYFKLLPMVADNFTLPLWIWIENCLPRKKACALKSFISHHAQPPVGLYARKGIGRSTHFLILYLLTHHIPQQDLELYSKLNAFKKAADTLIELAQRYEIDENTKAALLSKDVLNILEEYQLHSWLMSKYIEWNLSPSDTFQLIIKSVKHSQEGISVYQPIIEAHWEIMSRDLESVKFFQKAFVRSKLLASNPSKHGSCLIRPLLEALCNKARKQNAQTFAHIFAQYIIEMTAP